MATQADWLNQQITLIRRISFAMAKHPTLTALLAVLTLTTLSDYVKSLSKPVTRSQPLPKRFFSSSSPVLDYPYGNIADVGNLLLTTETLFVMYYAPWCAKSRRVAKEFIKAAEYIGDDVQFVGVNAWYPNGTCRKQNNFDSYPVLFFYHLNRDGYKYKGIMRAEYMIQFVIKMLFPLTYIYNKDEVLTFLSHNDNAVIGFFDFYASPQPPGFLQYYFASLRVYELDPTNPVSFAVITNLELAERNGFTKPNTIHYTRSLNSTLKFPSTNEFTSTNISSWVLIHRQGLSVSMVLPSGSKSVTLSSQLSSPTLIMFVPHYPLESVNPYASMLREVALDYYDCHNSTRIARIIDLLIYHRWIDALHKMELYDSCKNNHEEPILCRVRKPDIPSKRCCQSILVNDEKNMEHHPCDVCVNYLQTNPLSWIPCTMRSILDLPFWDSFRDSFSMNLGSCAEAFPHYNPGEFFTACCENHSYYHRPVSERYQPHGKERKSNDPFVIEAVKYRQKRQCMTLAARRRNGWESPSLNVADFVSPATLNVKGYVCETNRTIGFVVMDTRVSSVFAQRLGLNVSAHSMLPSVVLVDSLTEEHYMMNLPVTKSNIASFIQNFTSSSLDRHLRSSLVPERCENSGNTICVLDINSQNFDFIVMDNTKDVVVLFHTPSCGYCLGFHHIYLALAMYFKSSPDVIFTRLDGVNNDLPWQYTVDAYPTITIFPAHRKADSVTFPDHLEKTLPNLVFFVLKHGSSSLRLETGLSICSRSCINANIAKTAQRIITLNHSINDLVISQAKITDKLKKYQNENISGKIELLSWYRNLTSEQIWVKQFQLTEARYLHRMLLSTTGPFIEKHKLLSLSHRFSAHRQRFVSIKMENIAYFLEDSPNVDLNEYLSVSKDDASNIYNEESEGL